jgi:triacylglycerol lipase
MGAAALCGLGWRVGGGLGIGAGVITGLGCGVAWADTSGSTSSSSSDSSSGSSSTSSTAKSDSGSSAEATTPSETGDASERTETSAGSPVSPASAPLGSSHPVTRSAPPGVVVSTGAPRTSSRASANVDGAVPDEREATSATQTPDTDAPGARATSRHATSPAESGRSSQTDTSTSASASPTASDSAQTRAADTNPVVTGAAQRSPSTASPIEPVDGATTETTLFTAVAATEQQTLPSAPPAEIVSTTISTDLTPLIDELPTTPVAVPTLWTLVATVGREYERTTLVESPTVNPLAGQITNGLLTDTSTLTGQSTDPVSTGTIGTPTPGLSDLTPTAQLNAAAAEDPWTGEPSFVHEIFVGVFRVAGVVGRLFGAQSATSFLAPVLTSDSPPWFTTLGLDVQRSEFNGMPVWTVQSPGSTSGKTVVAIHGGGYVYQPSIFHWLDYAAMARDTGATVVVPIYPLAPQGTAATVVPQTADLISYEIDQHGAENVSVYGDSAGGGLALAAVQELVRRGDPVPSHMVLISPWLDASMSDPASQTIDDPNLNYSEMKGWGLLWAGDLDPADPRVSPLFGSLEGLPPTVVYSGSLDLLSPDTLRLRERALAEGADITFVLRKGLVHIWPTAFTLLLPEALAVRPDVYQQLGIGSEALTGPPTV